MILPFDKKVSHISAQDITRYDITKDREAVKLYSSCRLFQI